MVDKVKPLKIENSATGGTEIDPYPREVDPTEDYLAAAGLAFAGSDSSVLNVISGEISYNGSPLQHSSLPTGHIWVGDAGDRPLAIVPGGHILINDYTTGEFLIATEVIDDNHISPAAGITRSKLAPGTANRIVMNNSSGVMSELAMTAGHIVMANASGVATSTAVTGDVTISNTGVTAIASGVIVDADLSSSAAISRSKIANGTANHVVINATSTGALSSTALSSGQILLGNSSGVPTGTTVTGDVTISNAGVTAIASNVIVNADINTSAAIALNKLAATTVSRALVSDASGFITASAVTSTELGYLSGLTSSAQTQLTGKVNKSGDTMTGSLTVPGLNVSVDADFSLNWESGSGFNVSADNWASGPTFSVISYEDQPAYVYIDPNGAYNTGLTIGSNIQTSGLLVSYGSLSINYAHNGFVTSSTVNSSNTLAAAACHLISVAGSTAQDAYVNFRVQGITDWSIGVDNSSSDDFVISSASTLGTNNRLKISTAGVVTIPTSGVVRFASLGTNSAVALGNEINGNTGFYWSGTTTLAAAANGAKVAEWTSTTSTYQGTTFDFQGATTFISPTIRLKYNQATSDMLSINQTTSSATISTAGTTNAILEINVNPSSTIGTATYRLFRTTNTSGAKVMYFYRGDNSTTVYHQIGIGVQSTIFNLNQEDHDFSIRGDNGISFYSDASTDRIGIGTSSPAAKLHSQMTSSGANVEVLRLDNAGMGTNTTATQTFYLGGSQQSLIRSTYSGTQGLLQFIAGTGSTTQMQLDASGNVTTTGTFGPRGDFRNGYCIVPQDNSGVGPSLGTDGMLQVGAATGGDSLYLQVNGSRYFINISGSY